MINPATAKQDLQAGLEQAAFSRINQPGSLENSGWSTMNKDS